MLDGIGNKVSLASSAADASPKSHPSSAIPCSQRSPGSSPTTANGTTGISSAMTMAIVMRVNEFIGKRFPSRQKHLEPDFDVTRYSADSAIRHRPPLPLTLIILLRNRVPMHCPSMPFPMTRFVPWSVRICLRPASGTSPVRPVTTPTAYNHAQRHIGPGGDRCSHDTIPIDHGRCSTRLLALVLRNQPGMNED